MAAAANIEQGAAAVYRCIRKERFLELAVYLPVQKKGQIVGRGRISRDISKFNFQQELGVLTLSLTVVMNQHFGSE